MGCGASKPVEESEFDGSTVKWESNASLTTAHSKCTWVHANSGETTWCGEWRAGEDKSEGEKVPSMLYYIERDNAEAHQQEEEESGNGVASNEATSMLVDAIAPPGVGMAMDALDMFGGGGSGLAPTGNYRLLDKDGKIAWKWCASPLFITSRACVLCSFQPQSDPWSFTNECHHLQVPGRDQGPKS